MNISNQFRFGLEAEYVVLRSDSLQALWYQDLDCGYLEALLDSIAGP